MVHLLTRIGAAVVSGVTARVLGGRLLAGILERVLLTGDVGELLVPVRRRTGVLAVDRELAPVRLAEDWLVVAVPGLLAERAGLPAVPVAAVDLLLVLLRPPKPGLLAERAGLRRRGRRRPAARSAGVAVRRPAR